MIAKIAVSAAVFAIDKPYSYGVPLGMDLQPGQRVTVPFGRANKLTEGVVLLLEEGSGSIRHEVTDVQAGQEALQVHIDSIIPEIGTCDMVFKIILIFQQTLSDIFRHTFPQKKGHAEITVNYFACYRYFFGINPGNHHTA